MPVIRTFNITVLKLFKAILINFNIVLFYETIKVIKIKPANPNTVTIKFY